MLDLLIIGGSAAGTGAAIYSARRKLNFSMISEDFGGEVSRSGEIGNWPGIIHTTGIDLADSFQKQLEALEVDIQLGTRATSIVKNGEGDFTVTATKGNEEKTYQARAVVVATGVHPRHLGVPGEEEFVGKGVTYCTTCDGPLFKNKKVVTIGGGNGAMESALMLAEIASHVTLVNLNDSFKGEQVLIDKVIAHENIDVIYKAKTKKIEGEAVVSALIYEDIDSGEEKSIETQGVFVHIGVIPNSGIFPDDVELNDYKEVKVTIKAETNISGLFAAGDVTEIPFNQIAIATGQGVTAGLSAIEYINKLS